jgi:hypothetical protein
MRTLDFAKIACVLIVFCVAAAVASSAQIYTTVANVAGLPYFGPLIQR